MSAVVQQPVGDRRLPFTFARRHGVLVRGIEAGVADCVYRAPASPVALAEARRFLRLPVKLTMVDSEAFAYDSNGFQASATIGAGGSDPLTTYTFFDNRGQLLAQFNPAGDCASSTYDAAGLVTSSHDGRGVETQFVYNAAGESTELMMGAGLAGRSPLSIAALALYVVSAYFGMPKSSKEVSEVCQVSDGTIRRTWRKVHENRDKFIKPEWGERGGDSKRLPSP